MNEPLCLIDTDIFSYILKRMEPAYHRSREYLRVGGHTQLLNLILAGDMLIKLHAEKITNRCSGSLASYHCQGD